MDGDLNLRNLGRFCLLRENQWSYGEMDTTVRFSASNRSIYPLEGCSDWMKGSVDEDLNLRNFGHF